MAKPNPQDPLGRKRAEPVQEQEEEKDVEGAEKDANESEQKQNSEQNTLGNAALQSQMMAADDGGGGEGGGAGLAMRRADLESEVSYGGDGDGGDLPLTLEDLVRSWNPGIPKSKDRPSWLEPMPTDELPPEDPAYLEAVARSEPFTVSGSFTLDAQLQPSQAVVAASLLTWSDQAMTWTGQSVLERAMAHILAARSPFIQDPDSRILLTRARMAAASSLLISASPALRGPPGASDVGLLRMMLELAGHARHAEMVRIDPGVEGKQMPKTPQVFERCFQGPPRSVEPRRLEPLAAASLSTVLEQLFDMEDPDVYLPTMVAEAPEPEDDPLGLDAILAEFTKPSMQPVDALYYSALQSAERIAAATARTRVHTAALTVTVAQVARQWSSGAPTETLLAVCRSLDEAGDKNLRLLVEIARAAQKRSVPPKGLKAGLTRATRGLRKIHRTAISAVSDVIGGVLAGDPQGLRRPEPSQDVLTQAWADGEPRSALAWLSQLDATPENRAALHLTRAAAGLDLPAQGEALAEIATGIQDPLLAAAVRVFAVPCLLTGDAPDRVRDLGRQQLALGRDRRNGAVLADGAFAMLEATDVPAAAREAWLEAGRIAYGMGAPGALSLLARYRPPALPIDAQEDA